MLIYVNVNNTIDLRSNIFVLRAETEQNFQQMDIRTQIGHKFGRFLGLDEKSHEFDL